MPASSNQALLASILPSPFLVLMEDPSISTITVRLAFFFLLLSAALYANYESFKNLDVTVLSSGSAVSISTESLLACRRFDLMFFSNGRASRTIIESSIQMQKILYPDTLYPKKTVTHVLLHLATHNLPEPVMVAPGSEPGSFVIALSPSVVLERDARGAVEAALRRAMARVWVWDGDGTAPAELVDAMVEGLSDPGTGRDPIRINGLYWAELNRALLEGRWNGSTSAVGLRQAFPFES